MEKGMREGRVQRKKKGRWAGIAHTQGKHTCTDESGAKY